MKTGRIFVIAVATLGLSGWSFSAERRCSRRQGDLRQSLRGMPRAGRFQRRGREGPDRLDQEDRGRPAEAQVEADAVGRRHRQCRCVHVDAADSISLPSSIVSQGPPRARGGPLFFRSGEHKIRFLQANRHASRPLARTFSPAAPCQHPVPGRGTQWIAPCRSSQAARYPSSDGANSIRLVRVRRLSPPSCRVAVQSAGLTDPRRQRPHVRERRSVSRRGGGGAGGQPARAARLHVAPAFIQGRCPGGAVGACRESRHGRGRDERAGIAARRGHRRRLRAGGRAAGKRRVRWASSRTPPKPPRRRPRRRRPGSRR